MHKQVLTTNTCIDPKVKILNIHEKRKTKSETRMEDENSSDMQQNQQSVRVCFQEEPREHVCSRGTEMGNISHCC